MDAANPYRPTANGEYVPSAFAGRTTAYSHINQHLSAPNTGQAMVISGRRHIGKSALLWHFQEFFGNDYLGVYIPLRSIHPQIQSEKTLLMTFARSIQTALVDATLPIGRIFTAPPDADTTRQQMREWFRVSFLPQVCGTLRRRQQVVLLIDDAHLLLGHTGDGATNSGTFHYLSDVLQSHDQLAAVITVADRIEDDLAQLAPLATRDLAHRLHELTPEETALLMRIPNEYHITDAAVTLAYQATGGEPLLAQRIGFVLYEAAITQPMPTISEEQVRAALSHVVQQSHDQFRDQWQTLTLDERLVLSAITHLTYQNPLAPVTSVQVNRWLVETDYPLDDTATKSAMRGLEYAHIIRFDGDGVRVSSGMLQAWLLQHAQLDTATRSGRVLWVGIIVASLMIIGLVLALVLAIQNGWLIRPLGATQIPLPTVTLDAG